MTLAVATTQPFGATVAAEWSWWVALDVLIVIVITSLLALRDLSSTNRPFDWGPVLRSTPFLWLIVVQSILVMAVLVVLVGFGRATLSYGLDALWVALAGVSLLKSLPVGKAEDGQRLWSLADWLFKRFYRGLGLVILRQSDMFRDFLLDAYATHADELLDCTLSLISAIEPAGDAAKDRQEVEDRYRALNGDATQQLRYLVNWITPRTTRREWHELTGK